MQRYLRLVMPTRDDMPVRDEERVIAKLTEEPGSVTEGGLGILREDLQFRDAKRMQVGVGHVRIEVNT